MSINPTNHLTVVDDRLLGVGEWFYSTSVYSAVIDAKLGSFMPFDCIFLCDHGTLDFICNIQTYFVLFCWCHWIPAQKISGKTSIFFQPAGSRPAQPHFLAVGHWITEYCWEVSALPMYTLQVCWGRLNNNFHFHHVSGIESMTLVTLTASTLLTYYYDRLMLSGHSFKTIRGFSNKDPKISKCCKIVRQN